jgi:hypothetical protein
MYFPLLRGKQFELLALQDISDILRENKDKVSPIIEPVRKSSTLNNTLAELCECDINFTLIVNPEVGDLKNSRAEILEIVTKLLSGYSNFQLGVNVSAKTKHDIIQAELLALKNAPFGLSLIHNVDTQDPKGLMTSYSKILPIRNNIINFKKAGSRYYREFDQNTRIRLEDFFPMQEKNADYLPLVDSKFSEEHLYFKQDGFKGFGDFLTIGEDYSESGFLPYAIAIHVTYLDSDKKMRVKHFVSDSNDDPSDIAGKYMEALGKLAEWSSHLAKKTSAIELFEDLYSRQHFPGLGSLKKLSIMHHIELVLSVI